MQGQLNPKIVGATILGFALIAGAFTISSLQKDRSLAVQPAAVAAGVPQRVAIAVTDSDNNGVEDWRDEFVTSAPVILNTASSSYTPPDTLTGQMSIGFMEDVIRSRNYGPFGATKEEVVQNTVDQLAKNTEITLYDTPDITIMEEWDNEDILNYANTIAAIIQNNSVSGMDGELEILYDVTVNEKKERISELETITTVYQNYRDDTLKVPVPAFLAKQHLDLINTYHAIHEDVKAMSQVNSDPAIALLRMKRYQDDATGLGLALRNMYTALEPYSNLITSPNDPAVLFAIFSPDYKRN